MTEAALLARPHDDGNDDRAPTSCVCRVLLDDIDVMADIGALASERGVPQPLRISVAAQIVPPTRDDVSETLDYTLIHAWAHALAAERIVLVETFARRLALRCLARACVMEVEVRIGKPRALPAARAGAWVRIARAAVAPDR